MFSHSYTVRLADTDAAGVLYFANQLRIAHEAYEEFMKSVNMSINDILTKSDIIIPIVRCEADFFLPCGVGELITINLDSSDIGKSSYTIKYEFINEDDQLIGAVRTVHAVVKRESKEKVLLPTPLAEKLNRKSLA